MKLNEEELKLNVKKFTELYCGKDFDHELLLSEMRSFRREFNEELSKMFTVIDILEFLLSSHLLASMPELTTLCVLFITIPVTAANVERSFTKLKIIKSYSRSTISQERLDGLALLSIESEEARKMDKHNLISDFAQKTVRRSRKF